MIIVPNDSSSSNSESDTNKWVANIKASGPLLPPSVHGPPPAYLDITEPRLSTISSESGSRLSSIPNIKPSNLVHLSCANGSIKGSWLIDPSLSIPSNFLHQLPTGGVRSNIILESKNGTIDADIYVLPSSHSIKNSSKFILIHTQSQNGSVKMRLHDTTLSNGGSRLAVRLSTRSANGSIFVQLPRSFRGPIRIRTVNGNTRFSASMQAQLTPFSKMDHVERSFLGYFNPSQWEIGTPWEGDELSVETKNGSVQISYDDETQGPALGAGQSFLSKLFADLSM